MEEQGKTGMIGEKGRPAPSQPYLQPLEHAFVQGGALAREQRQAAAHRHRHGLGHVQQALADDDDDNNTAPVGEARRGGTVGGSGGRESEVRGRKEGVAGCAAVRATVVKQRVYYCNNSAVWCVYAVCRPRSTLRRAVRPGRFR